jgi:hypothetical protein
MRCICCNVILTPFESTVRSAADNTFIDTCERCLKFSDVQVLTREDLRREVGIEIANYIDTEDEELY